MDIEEHFRSLSMEFRALKDRVRNLVPNHWPTDGVWKEKVLQAAIRRHFAGTIQLGSGFIVTPTWCSKQVDILIYDANYPVLFRDSDFVIVSPESVRATIEVKTRISSLSELREVLLKISNDRQTMWDDGYWRPIEFTGVFAYDFDCHPEDGEVLEVLSEAVRDNLSRMITHLALGPNRFVRFWEAQPSWGIEYSQWREYLLDDLAFGYFLHNLITTLHDRINTNHWYPNSGKESSCVAKKRVF